MKLTYLIMAVATATSISSCSLLNSFGKKDSATKKETAAVENVTAKKTENKTTKTETDIETLSERLDGEWVIISAGGKVVPSSDDMPYVYFVKPEGRFYASNGCNVINGTFALTTAGALTFDNVLSTMKMCPETDYEIPISTILSGEGTVKVKISDVGHETLLSLINSKGTELIARKHNMDFLNGNWQIMSVNGKEVNSDDATIFIDINELKVHGNTGCNYFNGDLFINPERSNAIDFSNLASTRMACPNMEQESAIMLALEETTSAIQGSDNNVMLLSSSGKELMTLKSIPVQPQD